MTVRLPFHADWCIVIALWHILVRVIICDGLVYPTPPPPPLIYLEIPEHPFMLILYLCKYYLHSVSLSVYA